MSEVETIALEVGKLELRPGDVLVARVPDDWLIGEAATTVRKVLDKALPDGVEPLVVPLSVELTVLHADAAAVSRISDQLAAIQHSLDLLNGVRR